MRQKRKPKRHDYPSKEISPRSHALLLRALRVHYLPRIPNDCIYIYFKPTSPFAKRERRITALAWALSPLICASADA